MSTKPKEPCTRCGEPAAEMPQGKGFVNNLRLVTTTQTVARRLRLNIWTFPAWDEDRRDGPRMMYSDFALCNTCAGDVWAYAQKPKDTP